MAHLKHPPIPRGGVLILYKTSTVLGIDAEFKTAFQGTFKRDTIAADDWIPRGAITELNITAISDKASAVEGVVVEESMDGVNVHLCKYIASVIATKPRDVILEVTYPFIRFSYTNGGDLQTSFNCLVTGRVT